MNRNQEAEKGILSLMLSGNQKVIAKIITEINEDDFFFHNNKTLFNILTRLDSIDLVSVSSKIESLGLTKEIPSAFLSSLMDTGASVSSLGFFTKTIIEESNKRKYLQLSQHIQNMIKDKESTDLIKDYVEKEAVNIAKHGSAKTVKSYREILNDTMNEIQERAKSGEEISGIKTGIKTIDNMIFGLHPGQMITIAGRTGMGKSAFAGSLAKNIAMQKKHTLIFSLEMTDRELCYRDLSATSRIALSDLKRAKLSDSKTYNGKGEWERLTSAYGHSLDATMYVDDTGSNTIEKIRSTARLHMLNYGLDCIIIDHIQIVKSQHFFHGRTELVNYVSNECKGIAKELNIPVIVLSQIGRPPKGTTKFRPNLEDLKQSGAIEEDSDVVMLLYRDDYYNRDTPEYKNQMEINIAKCRDGRPGTLMLYCNLETMEFHDLDKHHTEGF